MHNSFALLKADYAPPLALKIAVAAAAVVSALSVILLLLTGVALLHLLASGGDLALNENAAAEVSLWAGAPDEGTTYLRRGMLPTAYQLQGTPWGQMARGAYRDAPILQNSHQYLLVLLGLSVVFGFATWLSDLLLRRFATAAAGGMATRLRLALQAQAFRVGGAEMLSRRRTGVANLFTGAVEEIRVGLLQRKITLPRAPLLCLLTVGIALYLHVWVALAAILLACAAWLLAGRLLGGPEEREAVMADRAEKQMGVLVECLKEAQLFSAHLLEDTPGTPFTESLNRYDAAALPQQQRQASRPAALFVVVLMVVAATLGIAGVNILNFPSDLTFFQAALLLGSLLCAFPCVLEIARLRADSPRLEEASAAILAYLQRQSGVQQREEAQAIGPLTQGIQIHQSTLRTTEGEKILNDLAVAVPAGYRCALVAEERMTLLGVAALFARFCDPEPGHVFYDGKDIRHTTLQSLRSQMAFVLQDSLLFTGSVADNIACGESHHSMEDIHQAAKAAHAYDLISALPQEFSTIVGQQGIWMPLEQQFLIGLTRAVIRKPSLLVLEEPRGEMDPHATAHLLEAVWDVSQGRSVVILASQLATIRAADRVYFLHGGKLHAEGSHNELVQRSDLYRHYLYQHFEAGKNNGAPVAMPVIAPPPEAK